MKLRAAIPILAFATTAFAQKTVIPLWPHGTPEPPQTAEPEQDVTRPTDALISGHRTARITNVTRPTMSVYTPQHGNGAAALIFPGGSYIRLAWDGEGVDTCKWLDSVGITCVLVKYRVPEQGRYPDNPADLEDAQQAMRLARAHAKEWSLDPNRIGVVGFSAGGNLAVLLSTHADDTHVMSTTAAQDVPMLNGAPIDARANFAVLLYPAYLAVEPEQKELAPVYAPSKLTPPTLIITAQNDRSYNRNTPLYYQALTAAGVPAEMHMFATGGHGFGVFPINLPESHWTELANTWFRSQHIIPPAADPQSSVPTAAPPVPCPPGVRDPNCQ